MKVFPPAAHSTAIDLEQEDAAVGGRSPPSHMDEARVDDSGNSETPALPSTTSIAKVSIAVDHSNWTPADSTTAAPPEATASLEATGPPMATHQDAVPTVVPASTTTHVEAQAPNDSPEPAQELEEDLQTPAHALGPSQALDGDSLAADIQDHPYAHPSATPTVPARLDRSTGTELGSGLKRKLEHVDQGFAFDEEAQASPGASPPKKQRLVQAPALSAQGDAASLEQEDSTIDNQPPLSPSLVQIATTSSASLGANIDWSAVFDVTPSLTLDGSGETDTDWSAGIDDDPDLTLDGRDEMDTDWSMIDPDLTLDGLETSIDWSGFGDVDPKLVLNGLDEMLMDMEAPAT